MVLGRPESSLSALRHSEAADGGSSSTQLGPQVRSSQTNFADLHERSHRVARPVPATASEGRLTRQATSVARLTRQATSVARLTRQTTTSMSAARLTRQTTLSKRSWLVWRRKRFEEQVQALRTPSSPWEHGWSLDAPLPAGTGLPAGRRPSELARSPPASGAQSKADGDPPQVATLPPTLPPGAASRRMLFTRLPPEFEAVQRDTGEPWLLPSESFFHPALASASDGTIPMPGPAQANRTRTGGRRWPSAASKQASPSAEGRNERPEERARRFSKLLVEVEMQRRRLGGDSWFAPLGADPLQQLGRSWGMSRSSSDGRRTDSLLDSGATAADDLVRPTLARYSLDLEPRQGSSQGSSPDSSFAIRRPKHPASTSASAGGELLPRANAHDGVPTVLDSSSWPRETRTSAHAPFSRPSTPATPVARGLGPAGTSDGARKLLTTPTNDPMAFSRRLSWIRATARDARSGVSGVIERLSASPAAAPATRSPDSPEPARASGPAAATRAAEWGAGAAGRSLTPTLSRQRPRVLGESKNKGGGNAMKRKDSLMTLPGLSRV